MAFAFYTDVGLASPLSGNIVFEEPVDHSSDAADVALYVGDPQTGAATYLRAISNPGVDQITISITDSAAGSGHADTAIKLALTQGDLNLAVGGASLNLGVQVESGAANAVVFWVRFTDATATQGTSTELGLETNDLGEY